MISLWNKSHSALTEFLIVVGQFPFVEQLTNIMSKMI